MPITRKGVERGFTLWTIAVCIFVMIGALGLAFDMGRAFVTKNELQTFVDASAMAGVRLLDGTKTGIQSANAMALAGPLGSTKPNGYNFDTTVVSQVTPTYGITLNGAYDAYSTASAPSSNTYQFIKVTATATTPVSFLAVLPGISQTLPLTVSAIAGIKTQSSATYGGLDPFMPDVHDPLDTKNFGFVPGVEYTLKWGNGGGGNNGHGSTTCAGDAGWTDPNPTPQHGFVDLGQGNGTSGLRTAIEYVGYPNPSSTPSTVYVGMSLDGVSGNRGSQISDTLSSRAAQDTDQTSTTYAQYMAAGIGNQRRIITVPLGDPSTWDGTGNGSEVVVGYGNFLLDPASNSNGNSGAICATYVGPGNFTGGTTGGSDGTTLHTIALYR